MATFGGGVLLTGWFFEWTMWHAGTLANPYKPVYQHGHKGPFHYTCNPAYLSMTIIYVGIAGLVNTLWAILFISVALLVIQHGVIEREERKFGKECLRYKAQVRPLDINCNY
ncbi:MAG: hypothetical protein JOZ19_05790 [Rubrobacter sp.]|nr:hypothetical protein [Rubrobacter sp.]